MDSTTSSRQRLVDFRVQVYASFTVRADALFELVDALLLPPMIRSAVEVSQSPLFRRRFASVYDALSEGRINSTTLRRALVGAEPDDALRVAGYAVYALDTTIAPVPTRRPCRIGPTSTRPRTRRRFRATNIPGWGG